MTQKATGYVRKIDSVGRIVIPSQIRKELAWVEGTQIEILYTPDGILLKEFFSPAGKKQAVKKFESMVSSLTDFESEEVLEQVNKYIESKKKD
ncbi:AbrB/MazE/SpoVT family DNA-binding domain-containing protein [Priestia aryabhattai]|uniref:AbrB/MazE/SpoVT family DNA-binding domain-containing protein n=1 Tax=Priestia aryabhattai TaxID=412384 RepID=UPI00398EB00B